MEKRVYNFSPGPAMLPLPALGRGPARPAGPAGRRHLDPGDQPPLQGLRRRSSSRPRPISASCWAFPTTTGCCSSKAGPCSSSAWSPMNFLRGTRQVGRLHRRPAPGARRPWTRPRPRGRSASPGTARPATSTACPRKSELNLDPNAAYVYISSNETIQGMQYPDGAGGRATCRWSATRRRDFLCRPVPVEKYGILFACAQKNAGPAGVTIVIIRDDLVEQSPADLPSMVNYKVLAEGKSLLEHPAELRHLHGQAGHRLAAQRRSAAWRRWPRSTAARPQLLYDVIDQLRRLLRGPRRAGQPLDHERDLPPARRRAWRSRSSSRRPRSAGWSS